VIKLRSLYICSKGFNHGHEIVINADRMRGRQMRSVYGYDGLSWIIHRTGYPFQERIGG
jgi:hypothetical protein